MKLVAIASTVSVTLSLVFFLSVNGQGRPDQKGGPSIGEKGPRPGHRGEGGPKGPHHDGKGAPGRRKHTATRAEPLELVEADHSPPAESRVEIREQAAFREIESNGIPRHLVGRFPNRGNPHEIEEQGYEINLPAEPEAAPEITFLHDDAGRGFRVFGITLDGVMMEPGTAETWMGRKSSGWNYEALGGAVALGLDTNYGHVQPGGVYHYHGLPTGLMKRLGHRGGEHSPQIGWAADGFPIYALYGYSDPEDPSSGVVELKTGYRLREGHRPGGENGPGGEYDGTFLQDYEFAGSDHTLDPCNGRFCVTPEFPEGTYAYFLTRDWPVIPRAFRGKPEQLKGRGGERRGGPRGGDGIVPGSPWHGRGPRG